ncbi:type I restriction enzyme S subunit [Chryseobacterium defluvii]|uniref:Type I restriction enzyme S subunit n=1 Tax=Chryseobacterium defluvii TaxID=160396 RepID=A0A840KB68_9FLAO|nr:restriction endonuclease subunit S [Chryseobacterium defluvii]MBB4804793.1 type I restriction enzyme S subunit [Chryseobacterium defluvii]
MRFPGFESEWEVTELNELGEFLGGGTPSSSNEDFWRGNIPWVSSSDLSEGDIHSVNISRFITEDAISNSATKLCSAPIILIVSRVGVGKVAYSEKSLCTSQDFLNIINFKCNGVFLSYLLSVEMKKAASAVQGTSIKGISSIEIKSKKLFTPKENEQQKIAFFLSLVDERITTQNKIIEELSVLKNTLAKRIFSQDLRFKDDKGNEFQKWQIKKLQDICEIIGGGTPETNKTEYWNGNIQWFTPTEIKSNYVSKSERTISELGLKNSSAKLLPKGTILLTTRATIGEASIALEECTTNQGFQSLITKEDCNNIFLFNWLKMNKYELAKRANGSTFAEISKSEIEKIEINFPSIDEQMKIADFLLSIDSKVDIETQLLKKLEEQKKFLLQEMFI